MSIRVSLTHRTTYDYASPAALGPQVIRLRPAPHNRTPIHSYSLRLQPEEHFLNWQQDAYGNYLARLVVPEKAKKFEVLVNLVADLEAYNPFDFFLESTAEEYPFKYGEEDRENLEPYLKAAELTPLLAKFVETVDRTPKRTVDFLVELNGMVHACVEYVVRMEPGVQTPEETLELKRGSCRDSAWLLVQTCRHLGLAARFVSGYLIQLVADEKPIEGPAGPAADFTDLHAWAEVYVPGAGWIGLDATSGLLTAEGHIPLACTPSPASASPVQGGVEKVETDFSFEMHVERIVDVPRVTKPYSEEEWEKIVATGARVDEVLAHQDLRLTMGGEPTFVSSENTDDEEWNTAALGPEKLLKGDRLARRLQRLWAEGALFHHGQGKWYPGEQLPRWAISIVSRRDGEAIWRDPSRFAASEVPLNHTTEDAERYMRALLSVLGLGDEGVMPAYEDVWYYLWKERRLPENVDPLKSKLADPMERDRLAKVFRRGLGAVIGYAVPLGHDGSAFSTGRWFLREEHCYLHPGDSPIGYRLPLDSTTWFDPRDSVADVAKDPTVERGPLPPRSTWDASAQNKARIQFQKRPSEASSALHSGRDSASETGPGARTLSRGLGSQGGVMPHPSLLKTALCTEVRGGILRVFLPPVASAEAFLELAAALERACEITKLKVQLEGYPAPDDSRLSVFKITPDPGVLEVNVPPTSSWAELVTQTEQLYEAAKVEKLTAEKFDVDGKHVGSGGGNHLVLGAQSPLDSPFLRRPDLLQSLISFWHNHPSLSFLFSGQFIGPTSQAPRVDEARSDSVYELEIAFAELARHQDIPPWLVDRALRHLLVDVTGNTHRTEFCIDKMYSPDSSTGRLGLLEMRAFEMPPHGRMASAQHLLVRSLLAAFAERPYREKLVKWGTSLHDRFLLPHFVKVDLADALSYLGERGFSVDPAWFEPHYQFRFPYYGEIVKDDVMLEVRGALEPWHVLGEEAGAGGQARYVDSSVERVQVKLRGATPGRHLVCVNGVEVPLSETGTHGEAVAGVRYRAWQPPSCLHPTIGMDGPLRFDLYDRWNGRAISGCTYHVVHPGGRAAEERPVNAVAAESRRIARFEKLGHTARSYQPRTVPKSPAFPLTLDLRRLSHLP